MRRKVRARIGVCRAMRFLRAGLPEAFRLSRPAASRPYSVSPQSTHPPLHLGSSSRVGEPADAVLRGSLLTLYRRGIRTRPRPEAQSSPHGSDVHRSGSTNVFFRTFVETCIFRTFRPSYSPCALATSTAGCKSYRNTTGRVDAQWLTAWKQDISGSYCIYDFGRGSKCCGPFYDLLSRNSRQHEMV